MELIGWLLVILLFGVGLVGVFIPVLPSVLAVYAAFFVYGGFFGFGQLGWMFWTLETLLVLLILVSDYAASAWGVRKFGGSKASVWGSLIGVVLGPFVIPVAGLLIGPFIGAIAGEMLRGTRPKQAVTACVGSVIGLFSSMAAQLILQILMIALFVIWIIV